MAHRQRRLLHVVAKGQRLPFRLLEDRVAHGVAELVLNECRRKIGDRVAKCSTLQRQDLQPGIGELLRQDAAGPAEADQHDVDGGKTLSHGRECQHRATDGLPLGAARSESVAVVSSHALRTPASRPAMLTNGSSYFLPYCSISAT